MKGKWFHILNITVLIIISAVGLLGWFGNAMSQVTYPSINFAISTTFVWWGIFYLIQSLKKQNTWRTVWFLISLGALSYWMAGGGASLYNLFLG